MSAPLAILGASSLVFPVAEAIGGVEQHFEAHWSGRFRKIGRFIKLALAGAAVAVKQTGLSELPARRTGIFLGTGLGNLADLVPFVNSLYDGSIPSPIQFANSVGNSGAFYIAQAYALEGPVQAISQDEVSFEAAVVNAAALLNAGEIDLALVGGVDVFMAPVSDHLARLGRDPGELSERSLAEGAGFWVLARPGARPIAELVEATVSQALPLRLLAAQASASVGPHTLFLGSRLREQETRLLAALGEGACLAAPAAGTFPTEAAAGAGAFAGGNAPAGALYHSLSSTREGLVGAITARKVR